MRFRVIVPIACLLAIAWTYNPQAESDPFIVKPYLQLGDRPALMTEEGLDVLWHARDADAAWAVEYRPKTRMRWRKSVVEHRRIAAEGIEPHRVYAAAIKAQEPGGPIMYRVLLDGKTVFESRTLARKGIDQPYRFAVSGDIAAGTPGQKQIDRKSVV